MGLKARKAVKSLVSLSKSISKGTKTWSVNTKALKTALGLRTWLSISLLSMKRIFWVNSSSRTKAVIIWLLLSQPKLSTDRTSTIDSYLKVKRRNRKEKCNDSRKNLRTSLVALLVLRSTKKRKDQGLKEDHTTIFTKRCSISRSRLTKKLSRWGKSKTEL